MFSKPDGPKGGLVPRLGKSRLILVAIVVVGLMSTGVALATTGAFDTTGDVIAGGERTQSEPMRLPSDETVLAAGQSAVGGPWRITSFSSDGVADDGEVLEPKGAPCIRLMLTDIHTGTGYCGVASGLSVISAPVERNGQLEEIFFGVAPEGAESVRITASDGKVLHGRTHEAVAGFPGDVWTIVAAGPLSNATVDWIDENGRRAGADREVTSLLADRKTP